MLAISNLGGSRQESPNTHLRMESRRCLNITERKAETKEDREGRSNVLSRRNSHFTLLKALKRDYVRESESERIISW